MFEDCKFISCEMRIHKIRTLHGFHDYRRKNFFNRGNDYGQLWIDINGEYWSNGFENVINGLGEKRTIVVG